MWLQVVDDHGILRAWSIISVEAAPIESISPAMCNLHHVGIVRRHCWWGYPHQDCGGK